MSVDGVRVTRELMTNFKSTVEASSAMLCALAGASSECTAEVSGIGYAQPTVIPNFPKKHSDKRPKSEPQNEKPWYVQDLTTYGLVTASALFLTIVFCLVKLVRRKKTE